MCGAGAPLSETGTPSASLKAETINYRMWHVRGLQRTINSNVVQSVQGCRDFLGIHTSTCITFVTD